MAEKKTERRRNRKTAATSPDKGPRTGQPTTGGSAPGGAPTGLRHQTDITGTGGGAAGVATGGVLPTGAGGGTGTGAGGLATGMAGIGGTRTLAHGAGRPSYGPAPQGEGSDSLVTTDTAETSAGHEGASAAEASTRSGSAGVEPEESPGTTVRGAGSGRV